MNKTNNMTTTTTDETTALILAGEGYQLTIAPEAVQRRDDLIKYARAVKAVADNDESAGAQRVSRSLAAMRIEVEKSRKLVKEPVNRIGKLIDQTAKEFVESIEAEEKRITKLVGDHATEVARIKAEKEREERRAFEEARAAREAAERAAAEAEAAREKKASIAEVIAAREAAKAAEAERLETLAARMEASADVAATNVANGVRFAWDFDVMDMAEVFQAAPEFITMEIKRSAVLAWLKELESADDNVTGKAAMIGIRAFKKPVVSSR